MNGKHAALYRIAKDGTVEDFAVIDIGVASYIHDWTMTETKLVILVQPWIQTLDRPPFINGFEWRPQDGLKVLIIDKDDLSKRRWAQADARAFYHTGAAWEESDGTIKLDAAFYRAPILGQGGGSQLIRGELETEISPATALTQLTIPPSGDGKMVETRLAGDFPQVDPRRHGLKRRLTAMVTGESPKRPGFTCLSVHDWETGDADEYEFGASHMVEEFLFVPKPGSTREQDAWLVGTAINIPESSSEFWAFDASDVGGGPVAVWRADYSWPLGFHGTWSGA
jgi:carotenoid cleavage dioxygenase-like enzyme